VIRFLPALPSSAAWSEGAVNGLRARNGFELTINWKDHRLTSAVLKSFAGDICHLRLPEGLNVYSEGGKKMNVKKTADGITSFPTVKGSRYFIK
jgi:alpha-L-fucosidase 2